MSEASQGGDARRRGSARRLRWLTRRATKRAWQAVCRRLYVDRSQDVTDSIVVAGTARSGTTWIGSTIAGPTGAREIFEPFNTQRVPEARPFGEFPYRRADEDDQALASFWRTILTGRIRGPWVDGYVDRLRPRGRVVKAVRANLMLAWMHRTFPAVPIVLVLRHPCAVAFSREQAGWNPDADIHSILAQHRLVADHLQDVVDVIHRARTAAAKRAVIWCVQYRVPLRQLGPGSVVEAWYEHLCRDPQGELPRLLAGLGVRWTPAVLERANQPSAKALASSAVVTGDDKVERWRSAMPPSDIDDVLSVVREFGMDHLYDDSPLPRAASLFP